MIRAHIIQYGPFAFLLLFLVFAIVKAIVINNKHMEIGFWGLFLSTMIPVSKQTIKNTFKERLKKYYKQSNAINNVFYALFGVTAFVYILMKMVGK